MPRSFLSARWSNLFLCTYAVPPGLLRPRLAPGLELDTRDGQAFVSLVAFDFLDTRVLGVGWPGFRNFAELNLRFYVRRGAERGVMFVREFVPQRMVAWVARTLYNEPYTAAPLRSAVRAGAAQIAIEHRLRWAGRVHTISATAAMPGAYAAETSLEHFFKEHQWGYGTTRSGQLIRYEVRHPIWQTYPVLTYRIDLDWARVYGPEWAFLGGTTPYSTVLAAGSPVQVFFGQRMG
ncbi:MAG: DUF2071 domain-containing protein [Kouleothrix sp.]|jgi:uncharacterized protein YqjF (DUF2071 family)|nr:DUF2071 domain-containing protein [Kouleothrix sp.]